MLGLSEEHLRPPAKVTRGLKVSNKKVLASKVCG